MFIIIGIMLTGMLFGYLLRSKRLTWIHKIITFLIWVLLFLLGIDVGGNDIIVKGLHTLGLEALIITLAAVIGSTLFAWGLWYLLHERQPDYRLILYRGYPVRILSSDSLRLY